MKRLFHILFSLLFTTVASSASARILKTQFEGVRQLGMGNAGIALADDANMLWYNPAGLSYVHGVHFNLFDFSLGADGMDTINRVKHAVFNSDFAHLIRPDTEAVQFQVNPTLIVPYFGISFFNNMHGLFDISNILSSGVEAYGFNDLGVMAAFSIPMTQYFSFGASLRTFERTSMDVNLTPQDIIAQYGPTASQFLDNIYNSLKGQEGTGYGFGLNAGAMLKLPLAGKNAPTWTLAATAEDIGTTTFHKLGSVASAPPSVHPSYNFGTALTYNISPKVTWNNALDMRDVFEPLPVFKQLHFGTEFRFPGFGIRGGVYQGYPTYGISIETPPHTRIYLSSYAVELGDKLNQRSLRWYLLQLVIGFNPL